jgi:hypothetical protein
LAKKLSEVRSRLAAFLLVSQEKYLHYSFIIPSPLAGGVSTPSLKNSIRTPKGIDLQL